MEPTFFLLYNVEGKMSDYKSNERASFRSDFRSYLVEYRRESPPRKVLLIHYHIRADHKGKGI